MYEIPFFGMLHMYLSHCKSQKTLKYQAQALIASHPLNGAIILHQDGVLGLGSNQVDLFTWADHYI